MGDSAGSEGPGSGTLGAEALAAALRELYRERDEALRARFSRSLPFQDLIFDRWERAKRLGFAEGASIYNSALVYGDVEVGRESWIGPNVLLDGSAAPLTIGAFCSIAAGVHVYTHDTVHWAVSGGTLAKRTGPVTIADCVYIGAQSVIALGTTIGRQCVIAANSFVSGTLEPGSVVAGSPARRVGSVIGEGRDVSVRFDER